MKNGSKQKKKTADVAESTENCEANVGETYEAGTAEHIAANSQEPAAFRQGAHVFSENETQKEGIRMVTL